MMTTVHKDENGNLLQFTKGAPDEILKRCSSYLSEDGVKPLTDEKRAEILAANKAMADKALRVLAAAEKSLSSLPSVWESETVENELCFVGLVGMIDPVRPEVRPAIDECRRAGIRPIMITGDHKNTAAAVAKKAGIFRSGDMILTGSELAAMDDRELESVIAAAVCVADERACV